ncbi:MAG: ACP phosphodiesterase, partial [Bacteroidia bacterium]
NTFLKRCGAEDTDHFFKFFSGFKSSRYLLSYQKLENLSYALQRICMRLWPYPFKEETISLLTDKLALYKEELEKDYLFIFKEIESIVSSEI